MTVSGTRANNRAMTSRVTSKIPRASIVVVWKASTITTTTHNNLLSASARWKSESWSR